MPGLGRVGATGGGPEDWFYSLPPVTRWLGVTVLASTVACGFGLLSPWQLYLDWGRVLSKFELWRLATTFLYFGGFSFRFVIQLYIFVQYSSRYEASPFNTGAGGTSADYAWMLVIGGSVLVAVGWILSLPFLSEALTFMIMYVWSKKNPDVQTSVFMFQIKALYLPWALTAFHLLIGNDVMLPLIGIGAGHVFYFFHFITPVTYNIDIIKTPGFLIQWFGGVPSSPVMSSGGGGARSRQAPPPRAYAGHNWGSGRVLGRED